MATPCPEAGVVALPRSAAVVEVASPHHHRSQGPTNRTNARVMAPPNSTTVHVAPFADHADQSAASASSKRFVTLCLASSSRWLASK